jgi:hypothetical protein
MVVTTRGCFTSLPFTHSNCGGISGYVRVLVDGTVLGIGPIICPSKQGDSLVNEEDCFVTLWRRQVHSKIVKPY